MRTWLPGAAAAALAIAAAAVVWQAVTPRAPDPTADASTTALRWQVGTAQRYTLRTDSTMRMYTPGGGTGTAPTRVQLNAVLDMLTLARSGAGSEGHVTVGLQLDEVQLRIDGQRDAALEAVMRTPVRVRYAAQGMPMDFAFAAPLTRRQQTMLENIVRSFQVTHRADAPAWAAEEQGASGAYVADYRRTGPLQLSKSKGRFDAPATGLLAGATLTSQEVIRLDPRHDWLASMTVEETLRAGGGDRPAVTIVNHAVLALQPSARVAVATDRFAFAAAPTAAAEPTATAARPAPRVSVAAARREILSRIPALDSDRTRRAQHLRRLGDLARVDPQLPSVIVEALRSDTWADDTRAGLFLVLEMAGTAAAQSALAAVAQDRSWSVADQSRAIVALGGVDRPDAQAINALWGLAALGGATLDAAKLAGDATFSLGRIAGSLRRAEDPAYAALQQRLVAGATGAGGSPAADQQRANHLLAIGNTGDPTLTDRVADQLADTSPVVRRAAAQALGALATDAAAERLVAQFGVEPSGPVRGAIAESLRHWSAPTPQAMQTLRSALAGEADERARHGIASLLGAHLAQHPENAAALRQLLRSEPSRRIRQAAADALASHARS